MKIGQILKQITPEVRKREIEGIRRVKLPSELKKWVKEYNEIGDRSYFFWCWIYKAVQETSLSVVAKKYQISTWRSEFLLVMFVILLDDVADKEKNKKLLNRLLKIPYSKNYAEPNKLNQEEKKYLKFTIKVWRQIERLIKTYPQYKEFKEILKYDIKQIVNAIEYDYLINKNHCLINKTEFWLYAPHTMQIVAATTIDLMCIPDFDLRELGTIREIVLRVQKMARIGNWLSTWEREIVENDFTSGVFAYALESGVLVSSELKKDNRLMLIEKIKKSKVERNILKNWKKCYLEIYKSSKKIKSVNIDDFIFKTEKLFIMYLATKGKI